MQRIVIGNLPMLGISYQGQQKDEEYKEKFSEKVETKKVMKVALRNGISMFAASSASFNEFAASHLEANEEVEKEEDAEVSLIMCMGIPIEFRRKKVNDYRRWKTHLTYESNEFLLNGSYHYLTCCILLMSFYSLITTLLMIYLIKKAKD